jgi:hypothetical protein
MGLMCTSLDRFSMWRGSVWGVTAFVKAGAFTKGIILLVKALFV